MTDQQEPGFRIGDRIYPVPAIDTFTFDELETLYGYCGLTIGDWASRFSPEGAEAWQRGVDKPGFQMALVHVAYKRRNPTVSDREVRALVGASPWLDVVEPLLTADEPDPLATSVSTSEPDGSSRSEPSDSEPSTKPEKPNSGTSSPTGSGPDASPDVPIGTSGSDTPSTSVPLRQVI